MKQALLLGLCILAASAVSTRALHAGQAGDEAAIREVAQRYFDGIIDYNEAPLRRAFHPEADIIGTTDEGVADWEAFQEWVLYTRGDAPDPAGRDNRIVCIDISGSAAVVKTELDWPHVR